MAMLLYEAPPGIAIFSVDGGYLNDPAKSFWECLPPLSLKEFITNETVPSPIDTTNKAIDNHLAKRLTELCGSEKKLVVGNAEYKRIIEMSLRITCLHVDVPDCEVVICSLRNPMYTLLPRKLSNPAEDLTLFLKQHDIGFKPEMVNSSIVKEAHSLHENESREKEYLKFFRLLLNDFLVKSGIDAKRWNSIHFATALKVICYPGASYVVYRPDQIFPCGVYQKIKDHASGYDIIFHKIDVLSVYDEVISLNSDKFLLLSELDILLMNDKEDLKITEAIRLCEDHSSGKPYRIDLRTGSKVQKEASTNVDGRLYKVRKEASTNVDGRPYTVRKEASTNVDGRPYTVRKEATNVDGRPYKVRKEASTNNDGRPYKVRKEATTNVDGRLYSELDFSRGRQEHDARQTRTILEGHPPVERPSGLYNEEICNKKNEGQHWLERRIYRDVPPQVKRRLLRWLRAAGACGES